MPKKLLALAPQCSVDYAFQRVGGKHKGRLVWHLQDGPVRYGQLRRLIEGVSPKMLTQALRELEEDGLVTRHIFVEVPPRVEYALTESGAQLLPFIGMLKGMGRTADASHGGALNASYGTGGRGGVTMSGAASVFRWCAGKRQALCVPPCCT
jgi:DNA-binding HxlR family transcriptional regulator